MSINFRDTLPDFVFPDMLSILARLSHTLFAKLKDDKNKLSDKTVHMVELTTECFRSLRNACAGCKRNQEEVLRYVRSFRHNYNMVNCLWISEVLILIPYVVAFL